MQIPIDAISMLLITFPFLGLTLWSWACLEICLSAHDLRRVDCLHLIHPSGCWNDLPHRAHLIGCITRNANIIAALENVLNVANIQLGAVAELGEFAGIRNDIIYKVIGELQDRLHKVY